MGLGWIALWILCPNTVAKIIMIIIITCKCMYKLICNYDDRSFWQICSCHLPLKLFPRLPTLLRKKEEKSYGRPVAGPAPAECLATHHPLHPSLLWAASSLRTFAPLLPLPGNSTLISYLHCKIFKTCKRHKELYNEHPGLDHPVQESNVISLDEIC